MIPILQKIHSNGKTLGQAARELNLASYHLTHFIHRRYHKVSRANRKLIRAFFIEQGWLPKPRPRPRCSCGYCGKIHVKGKKNEKNQSDLQDDQKMELADQRDCLGTVSQS